MATASRRPRGAETAPPPPPPPEDELHEPEPARRARANGKPTPAGLVGVPPRFVGISADADFWDDLSQFSSDDWNQLIAYLWRTAPTLDRKFAGKPTNIRKYTTKFDLERIMTDEGSGGYRIDLCWINPTGAGQKRIAQHYEVIMNMDYPPRVPAGEWLNDPDNENWRWAEKRLRAREVEERTETAAGAAAAGDPNQLFTTVLNGIRVLRGDKEDNGALAASVLELAQTSQARVMELSDPVKQLSTLKSLLESLTPKTEGESIMLSFLREELRETRAEMRAMREAQTKPQPDLITQLIDNAPKIKDIASLFGFGSRVKAEEGPTLAAIGLQVVDKLADHIPEALELWKWSAMNKATAPNPAQQWRPTLTEQQQQPAPAQAAPPAAAPSAAGAAPPPAAEQSQQENLPPDLKAEQARMSQVWQKYQQLLTAIMPFMVDHFRTGIDGYEFKDWFIDRHGRQNWLMLRDEAGSNTLANLAGSHPMLKEVLKPREKLIVWLNEFFSDEAPNTDIIDVTAQTEGTAHAA